MLALEVVALEVVALEGVQLEVVALEGVEQEELVLEMQVLYSDPMYWSEADTFMCERKFSLSIRSIFDL